MALVTPRQSAMRYRLDKRKVSHGYINIAVIKEQTCGPGYAISGSAVPGRGISKASRQAPAAAKPHTTLVPAMLACGFTRKNRTKLHAQEMGRIK